MSSVNEAVAARWFREFWGESWNVGVISDLAAPEIRQRYPLHEPKIGHRELADFMGELRRGFPDFACRIEGDLLSSGNHVVVRWVASGTHTGPAYTGFRHGSLRAASGLRMRFAGTSVLRIDDRYIVEDLGQEDGVTAMLQLGLLATPGAGVAAAPERIPLPPGWNNMPSRLGLPAASAVDIGRHDTIRAGFLPEQP